jgi:hypothetical protein
MITMAEIDAARANADGWIESRRTCDGAAPTIPCHACAAGVERAEAYVERLLRQWWAQGCKEAKPFVVRGRRP